MAFIKYQHDYGDGSSAEVVVREDLKGKHKEHCLCFTCKNFKPGTPENCQIAQEVYQTCVKYSLCTPVWECPKFEEGPLVVLK